MKTFIATAAVVAALFISVPETAFTADKGAEGSKSAAEGQAQETAKETKSTGEEKPAKANKEAKMVSDGSTVKLHYKLTVEGDVVDSSEGRDPLEFTIGGGQVIPGFEKGVMGLKSGDSKSFEVSPEDGYGPTNPEATQEVPKNQLPPEIEPQPGMQLQARSQDGRMISVTISEVKEETVVVDFNHPLAGKTLNFAVDIVEVN